MRCMHARESERVIKGERKYYFCAACARVRENQSVLMHAVTAGKAHWSLALLECLSIVRADHALVHAFRSGGLENPDGGSRRLRKGNDRGDSDSPEMTKRHHCQDCR
jgi:hypothetical protein